MPLKPVSERIRSRRGGVRRLNAWMRSANARCMLILLLGSLGLLGLFCLSSAPERYNLTVGSISHQTITATKDVEDPIATEERRRAAAAAVEPTYHMQSGVAEEVLSNLDAIFDELRTVMQYGHALQDGTLAIRAPTDEEIAYAQSLTTLMYLTRQQAMTLLTTQTADFDGMVSAVRLAVENALNNTIREGQVNQSIQTIRQVVGYGVEASLSQSVLPAVLNACIQPNMVIEQQKTQAAREQARNAVEPVMYLQGQNIIRQGERVSLNQLEMLRALGLLENNEYDLSVYGGAALLIIAVMAVLVLLLNMLQPELLSDARAIAVIMVVLLVSEALAVLLIKILNVYLAPVALCAMLLTGLLGSRAALCASMSASVLIAGLTAGSNMAYSTEMMLLLLMGLVSSVLSIQFLRGKPHRVRILACGLIVAVNNLLLMLAVGMMTAADLTGTLERAAWAMGGGVLSSVLALGLQAVMETVFNLATPSKLLELSNPNQPLLRRLLLEAPGTYHHSILVANLAEAAAEKIGANPLLARTAAYFHDVGKLKRPSYFKENQMGENPHDRTDPYVSAAILTSHTHDGLQLAQKHRLPVEIQDIIVQHHGDSAVMYFYHKALQQSDGKAVEINDFRYDSVRPASREAAIVMMADTIEAAVRSMADPTPQAIESYVDRLVRGKLDDGQFNNAPLTLRDISNICEAFCTVLNGVYHDRIEYPVSQTEQTVAMPPEAPSEEEAAEQAAEEAEDDAAATAEAPSSDSADVQEENA